MATKTANVTARVQPEIKKQAEEGLEEAKTEKQFHAVMAKGLEEAKTEKGKGIDDAFAEINTGI